MRKKVTKEIYDEAIKNYYNWKSLTNAMKSYGARAINLPEGITEPICCYHNNFLWSKNEGSEDAVSSTGDKIQIKATGNYNSDLTSFGPRSEFSELHFVRLNQETDTMELYKIPIDDLAETKVNSTETFKEQQAQGRRPRLSIIDKFINPKALKPYKTIQL
ncbi:MAG: Bsp6I family type II restriction endonuclease [Cetobacterium sp.]|nr:Bsp6I family type II restriction endonuclease [Cetobacterium sp.]